MSINHQLYAKNSLGGIMVIFIQVFSIFMIGCLFGWVFEFLYRRIAHGRWINPGFLVGPYLPLYGTGILLLYGICSIDFSFIESSVLRNVFVVLFITAVMTALELITGIIFVRRMKIALWDYSEITGNYLGVICPLFSLAWGVLGGVYFFFIHPFIDVIALWFSTHPAFSFFVGIYYGFLLIDLIYSFKNVDKKQKIFAKNRL